MAIARSSFQPHKSVMPDNSRVQSQLLTDAQHRFTLCASGGMAPRGMCSVTGGGLVPASDSQTYSSPDVGLSTC